MIFFFFLIYFFSLCMYQNTKIKTVNFKKDNLNVLNICKTKVKKEAFESNGEQRMNTKD